MSFRQPRPAREGLPAKRPPPSCKAQFARVTPGSASAREAPSLPKLLQRGRLDLGPWLRRRLGYRAAPGPRCHRKHSVDDPLFGLPLAFLLHPTANDSTCQAAEDRCFSHSAPCATALRPALNPQSSQAAEAAAPVASLHGKFTPLRVTGAAALPVLCPLERQ